MSLLLGIIVFLLLLEGFFSGSELALISADRMALQKKSLEGDRGAQRALTLLSKPDILLATLITGTTTSVVTLGILVHIYIQKNIPTLSSSQFILVLTPLIVIFGELIPKILFQKNSLKISCLVSTPILFFQEIISPLIYVFTIYSRFIQSVLGHFEDVLEALPTPRESLQFFLTHRIQETSLKPHEGELIEKILNFSKMTARNVMVPLVQVDALDSSLTLQGAKTVFEKSKRSRLPIFDHRIDNIIGVLHIFDVFKAKNLNVNVKSFMATPLYVAETQKVDDILLLLQQESNPFAIVVDEYGGAQGIVTLEDLIEEIVGDIEDEYDAPLSLFKKIGHDQYLIEASMEIDAIRDQIELNIPPGQYETLAGFLILQFNRIPTTGDELYYGPYRFEIKKASPRKIEVVLIQILPSS